MSYISFAKQHLTRIPYSFGKYIALVPYGIRPGMSTIYPLRKSEIANFNEFNSEKYKHFIFEKVKNISVYAYTHIEFYKKFYKASGVNPNQFSHFNNLFELPIISKAELQAVPIEERSNMQLKKSIANTGGSSGQPLSFYIEPSSIPHEWAHMHTIWAKLGYKQNDLKIVFGGRADVKNTMEYDAVRHQLTIDIYKNPQQIADTLLGNFQKYKPKYLHGYPSAIFDFIIWLDLNKHPLLAILKQYIQGMFLGSEFPSPILRKKVEELLSCSSVSWYGHTERAVLAYEKDEQYTYSPFVSYGFAEAIKNEQDDFSLVATTYHNYASPLIRYDTSDLIEPNTQDGLLVDFKISSGRNGEYVLDRHLNKIYLTALIFGRHHSIFDYVQHVQVKQIEAGKVTFYITSSHNYSHEFLIDKMDLSNVDLEFSFEVIQSPIKTAAAKVPLLIKNYLYNL